MMMVPSRAMPVIKSPLLGWGTKLKMGLEYFRQPPPVASPDRSVSDFVSDHFGQETLDYLAEPLLSGVYGGDPGLLSIRSVMPRFADMETKYGSLVRGVLASRNKNAPGGAPLFRTLKGGLGTLVDALASKVKLCQTEAASIEKTETGFRVFANGAWMEAANVVVACPAWSASHLLHALDQPLAAQLGEIGYSSSVILSLIYDASPFDGFKAGFGFLVPKKERKRLAACTYVSTKFAHRTPENRIALRCFFGGISDGAVLEETDESIIAMAREELRHKLGLTTKPLDHLISRWPRAMAQYNVGHAQRIAEIRARAAAIPGLYLAGNAYEGIGIPDCIRTGRAAAAQIVQTAE